MTTSGSFGGEEAYDAAYDAPGGKFLNGLTPEQRTAVTHPDEPLLVLAGAGTGKTKSLTARIAWRLEQGGVSPGHFLVMTFTHKAADEMKDRLSKLIGPTAKAMDIGTYHSLFAKAIRDCDGEGGLSGRFSILDETDQRALFGECYSAEFGDEAWKRFKDDHKVADVLEEFSRLKMSRLPGQEPFRGKHKVDGLEHLLGIYTDAKKREDVADYDDILFTFDEALDDPRILTVFRSRWRNVLVDEFQDTNAVQMSVLQKLTAERRNITCVGDDDQAIYGWRGADVRNILSFTTHWPEAGVIRLEDNFRSSSDILRVANALIACNSMRHGKTLRSTKPANSGVRLRAYDTSGREADAVVDQIRRLIAEGGPPQEIAVIARTANALVPIEHELVRHRVPYVLNAGRKVSERLEMKVIAAYARCALNDQDQTAFLYAFESRSRGLGDRSLGKYRESARAAGTTIEAVMRSDLKATPDAKRGAQRYRNLETFMQGLDDLRAMVEIEMKPRQIIEAILDVSMINATLEEDLAKSSKGDAEARSKGEKLYETRKENLAEILDTAETADALVDLTTNIVLSNEKQQDKDTVWLGTIHAAKGLEFDNVFIPAFEHGILPSPRVADTPNSLEYQEERNLGHVAITRARARVQISYAAQRRIFGKTEVTGPSAFLDELGIAPERG